MINLLSLWQKMSGNKVNKFCSCLHGFSICITDQSHPVQRDYVELWQHSKMSMECERRILQLSCIPGRTITVIKAFYGRQRRDHCPDPFMPASEMRVNCYNVVTSYVASL